MFFVPIMWTGYEMACLTPSGQAAIGVTADTKLVRILGRAPDGTQWKVLREWPQGQLSHTDIIVHLGGHPEPDTAEGLLALLAPLEANHAGSGGEKNAPSNKRKRTKKKA